MNEIYINSFEQSKIDFSEFVTHVFNEYPDFLSFTLSLKTKHIVFHGIKNIEEHYLNISSICMKNHNEINIYCEDTLIESQKNSHFFTKLCFLIRVGNECPSNYPNTIINKIKQQNLYHFIQELRNEDTDSLSWEFVRDSLSESTQKFLGLELIRKRYTIDLLNSIPQKFNIMNSRYKI